MWKDEDDVLTTSHVSNKENPWRTYLEDARWCMKHERMMGICVLVDKNQVLLTFLASHSLAFKKYKLWALGHLLRESNLFIEAPNWSEVVLII